MNPKWIKIASAFTAGLTMLSVAPYELGTVADVFPPGVKKWTMILGTGATVILRIIGHVLPPSVPFQAPAAPVLQPPSNVIK